PPQQQGKGKSKLRGNQQLPPAARFFPAAAGARLLVQRVADADLGNAGERKQPDKNSGYQGQPQRNEHDSAVHVDFVGAWEPFQPDGVQSPQHARAQSDSANSSEQSQP